MRNMVNMRVLIEEMGVAEYIKSKKRIKERRRIIISSMISAEGDNCIDPRMEVMEKSRREDADIRRFFISSYFCRSLKLLLVVGPLCTGLSRLSFVCIGGRPLGPPHKHDETTILQLILLKGCRTRLVLWRSVELYRVLFRCTPTWRMRFSFSIATSSYRRRQEGQTKYNRIIKGHFFNAASLRSYTVVYCLIYLNIIYISRSSYSISLVERDWLWREMILLIVTSALFPSVLCPLIFSPWTYPRHTPLL